VTAASSLRHATRLETVSVRVPAFAREAYEAALGSVCGTVGSFGDLDEPDGEWVVEGVKPGGEGEAELDGALAIAALVTGVSVVAERHDTPVGGWLARSYSGFPEQHVGRRLTVRGTHLSGPRAPGRITLVLDAGIAFGSGEHGSTRGCLRALELVARRRPVRVLDLGTGSGILAMAAARLLRPVRGGSIRAADNDPWSVRTAADNARLNGLAARIRFVRTDGWRSRSVGAAGPYDFVFANILARPLCGMAAGLAAHLAPGGVAILSGLLTTQARMVLAAHRRRGLVLAFAITDGAWTTLVVRQAYRKRKAYKKTAAA
jgi:ribosomal protein L11 methyltransferase